VLSSSLEFPQGWQLGAPGRPSLVPLGGQEAVAPETSAVVGVSRLVLGSEGSFQNVGCLGGCALKSMAMERARNALKRGQLLHGNVLLWISMSLQCQAEQR